jgi:hypothetical protein
VMAKCIRIRAHDLFEWSLASAATNGKTHHRRKILRQPPSLVQSAAAKP